MDIRSWALNSAHQIRQNGTDGLRGAIDPVYHFGLGQFNRFFDQGDNIYEYDWDLLVILDACRADLMSNASKGNQFISNIDTIRSVNSDTVGWMRNTFPDRKETSDTVYICGNPFSESELDGSWFADLREVWQNAWKSPGTVPPRAVTDETIRAMRGEDHKRVIAHYMQPHCPFIPAPELSQGKMLDKFGNQDHRDVWGRLRDGILTKDDVWDGYQGNLNLVLEDVELLLNSVDVEKAVISSDHGNAIGEWGVYGHPTNIPLDCLREVPWIETTASNNGNYEPSEQSDSMAVDRDDQLRSLGYL